MIPLYYTLILFKVRFLLVLTLVCHLLSSCTCRLIRFPIAAPHLSEAGISLSLPFIHSISLSSSGIVAIGTADGRIWIGHGGEKREPSGNKKRSRKWGGLKPDEGIWIKAAEGPVVSVYVSQFEHRLDGWWAFQRFRWLLRLDCVHITGNRDILRPQGWFLAENLDHRRETTCQN
jgi:hypothetical protein